MTVIGIGALGLRVASTGASVPLRESSPGAWILYFLPLYALLAVAGSVVVARPRNLAGWSLFLVAVIRVVEEFGYAYGLYPELVTSGPLPLAYPAVLMGLSLQSLSWAFLLPAFLAFPSGKLTRRTAVVAGAGMVLPVAATALVLLRPDAHYGPTEFAVRTAARTYGPAAELAVRVAWPGYHALTISCAVWALFRTRRGDAVLRQQGKWLLAGSIPLLAWVIYVGGFMHTASALPHWFVGAALLWFAIALGVGITKHHLFDIDVLLSKALLYFLMAAVIALVYTVLVGGLGYVFGTGSPSFVLSVIGATGAALVLFPLQERLRHYANTMVFGRKATPYEAMSAFSRAIGEALRQEDVLPAIAEAVRRGTGAEWVEVASLISGAERTVEVGERPDSAMEAFDVSMAGEKVGRIALRKRGRDVVTPTERNLLEDLAAQAGPALRNVGLTLELERRLNDLTIQAEALRRSRERIVAAQDAARMRIERDLHDGVQQSIVSLVGQLRVLSALLTNEPHRARELVVRLTEEAKVTLSQIRDLAHGVFPQILTDAGIVPALRSHVQQSSTNVHIAVDPSLDGLRLSRTVEVAVYFCCLEALQNVTKHGSGGSATLSIGVHHDSLTFTVSDDGPGFPADAERAGTGIAGMKDRLAAVGGTLEVFSEPGAGTVVSGVVPVDPVAQGVEE